MVSLPLLPPSTPFCPLLQSLIDNKSISINSLLAIAPSGTPNPTVHIYDSTMYALGGIVLCGLVLNQFIHRADPAIFITEGDEKEGKVAATL